MNISIPDRFWSKVDRSGDCWIWMASKTPAGYGRFRLPNDEVYAHRMAYELAIGPIPDGMCVCHICDVPACCNPAHLWLGSHQENIADRDRKGRLKAAFQREDVKIRNKAGAEKRKDQAKARWNDPETRAKMLSKRKPWTPEARASLKAAMNRPDVRARISETLKKTLKERKAKHV